MVRGFFFTVFPDGGISPIVPPVLPQDIVPLLGSEDDTFCARLIALTKLSWLIFKFVRWMINADGTGFSTAFKAWLCTVECEETV